MATHELERERVEAAAIATASLAPTGEISVGPGGADDSLYGPVEIAWYPDRLRITARGAGGASIAAQYPSETRRDLIVEIRPAELDELPDDVPGAD